MSGLWSKDPYRFPPASSWGMGGEEEGEESREESSGGNCEEKVDGEHSVGEIGENACG